MAAMVTVSAGKVEAEGDQLVVLHDVGWEGYRALLRLKGDRRFPKLAYLDGSVYLISPCFSHERLAERLGMLVMEVAVGLRLPCISAGSTTFRRRGRRGGVEGDKTFYLANEARIRGKREIDLRVDPPPDLAIEVAWTHPADEAIEVYRRLRVPEVWVCDDETFVILSLGSNRRYTPVGQSLVIPALAPGEVHGWVTRDLEGLDTDWILAVRDWVANVLAARLVKGAKPESP